MVLVNSILGLRKNTNLIMYNFNFCCFFCFKGFYKILNRNKIAPLIGIKIIDNYFIEEKSELLMVF